MGPRGIAGLMAIAEPIETRLWSRPGAPWWSGNIMVTVAIGMAVDIGSIAIAGMAAGATADPSAWYRREKRSE